MSSRMICRCFGIGAMLASLFVLGGGTVAQQEIPPHVSMGAIAIVGATVINVEDGSALVDATVVVSDGNIQRVGTSVPLPPGSVRIDGSGKFLIPGLWDMHSHLQGAGEETLELFIANGVVGARDMGSDLDFILPLRDRVRRGDLLGPELIVAGPILDNAPAGWPFRRRVVTAGEGRAAVRDLKQAGVDFIKVHNFTTRDSFFAIADEARRLALPLAGHIPLKVSVEEGLAAGMASVEHLSEARLFRDCSGSGNAYSLDRCRDVFAKGVANGVWQTPTGAFYDQIPDVFSGKPVPHAQYATESIAALVRANIAASNLDDRTLAVIRARNVEMKRAVSDLAAARTQLLAGCDGWVPGFCLHDELRWLTEAGLSPLDALRTTTVNPAKFLKREGQQGTVSVGARADLLLLDGDPRVNIGNTSRINTVVFRGRAIQRPELDAMIARRRNGTVAQ